MERVHLIIFGDVQGIGFRSWALRYAQGKPISGWVKNREDGTVEIVAEGQKEELEALIALCRKGPDLAWVAKVEVAWQEATGELFTFEVRR